MDDVRGHYFAEQLGADVGKPDHQLALAFWDDVSDRRGLKSQLEGCDADVKREIFATWVQIIEAHRTGRAYIYQAAQDARESLAVSRYGLASDMGTDTTTISEFEGGRLASRVILDGYADHLGIQFTNANGRWKWHHKEEPSGV